MRLFDFRLADGSRHFAELPETYDAASPQWNAIHAHVAALAGAKLTGFVTDEITEAWIDFDYAGHEFKLNNQSGWWLIVEDPTCPDATLEAIYVHFEALLAPRASHARRFGSLARGSFRVVVSSSVEDSHHDFETLPEATTYAKDCKKGRVEHGPTYAYVFDDHFEEIV